MVRHRLRIDLKAESLVPFDHDTVERDRAHDAAVADPKTGFHIVTIELDLCSDSYAGPEASGKMARTEAIHSLTFVFLRGMAHPPKEAGGVNGPSKRKVRR